MDEPTPASGENSPSTTDSDHYLSEWKTYDDPRPHSSSRRTTSPPETAVPHEAAADQVVPSSSETPRASLAASEASAPGTGYSGADAVAQTFVVLAKSPLLYIVLAALATLPGVLFEMHYRYLRYVSLMKLGIDTFFSVIFMAAIAYAVHQDLVGGKPKLGEAITAGLSRYLSVVGVSLLFVLGVGFLAFFMVVFNGFFSLVPILILIYGLCVYCVSIPACVAERISPLASLDRSATLTSGHRWSIFGVFFLYVVAVAIIVYIYNSIFPPMPGRTDYLKIALSPLSTAFSEVLLATIYFKLRVAKEGVSVDKLATVFD